MNKLLQRLRDWRQRRKWAAMHLEWLRTMVYGDARWLALNPIASALTERYEAALRDDWYALDHEDTPRLRTRLGLDPSRATGRAAAPDAARLAIEAVLQNEYVALKPGECVPLQTSAPVTYPGLEAIYMAGMEHTTNAPSTAARPSNGEVLMTIRVDAAGALADIAGTKAAADVLSERERQKSGEGWTAEHDDDHVNNEIASLATYYAMPPAARNWPAKDLGYGDTVGAGYMTTIGEVILPWNWRAKVDGDRRRELVKAGALVLAEIERLDRAEAAALRAREAV